MTDARTSSPSLADLIGQRVGFCGVDNNALCVVTPAGDRLAFEATEDPCDGYRSMLGEVKAVPLDGLTFFAAPVATLTVRDADARSFQGYELVDDAGHVWLRLGTDNYDDYYPYFTFGYDPPKEAANG